MLASYFTSIRNLLKNDSTLQTLLGGEHVYIAHVAQANQIPSITLLANNETSKKRVGYQNWKLRDMTSVIQMDVWSDESFYEVTIIANRIDVLLNETGVSGTRGWPKVTDSDQFEPENKIYHKTIRYEFTYEVDDT